VIHGHVERERRVPDRLSHLRLGDAAEVVPVRWRTFRARPGDVRLTAELDALAKLAEGSLRTLDYKPARFAGGSDAPLPAYRIRANSLRVMAEAQGFAPVSKRAPNRLEPPDAEQGTCEATAQPYTTTEGLAVPFAPRVAPVTLGPAEIRQLRARARDIFARGVPPTSAGD
jgi:hypothetical protein